MVPVPPNNEVPPMITAVTTWKVSEAPPAEDEAVLRRAAPRMPASAASAPQAADLGADAVVDLADEQAIDAGLAAAAPGGYDVIVDFLWGGVAPHAMNHANPGARYIQVGNSAGPASTITGLVLHNKLLTLIGHSLFATPAEVRRSAYAQMAGHAIDSKLTMDLEQTRLEDIGGTWEHLKTGAPRKLVVTP
jgi:NADPH:quinone reductase-like Zn-dependent oxidoreductase